MKTERTHITVLLDRTGSMESIRDDTIGGFNAFLARQKAEPGAATLTLVQFDSQDPYEVIHRFRPIGEVPELSRETYVPRASTPLLDAMGRAINDLEESIAGLKAKDRPSKVVMAIVPDGQENASREFRRDQIERMIRERTERDGWQFVFLSADLAAINDAMAVGLGADQVLLFARDADSNAAAWGSLSARTSDFRSARRKKMGFDRADRRHPDDPGNRKA